MQQESTITFVSSYGYADESVGVVKSVIAGLAPLARVVDLSHGVEPGDVNGAGLLLARSSTYLNPGVVLVAVDSDRLWRSETLVVQLAGGESYLVGPDCGVLAPLAAMNGGATQVFKCGTSTGVVSARDRMASTAAQLASFADVSVLGVEADADLVKPGLLSFSEITAEGIAANVLGVDREGSVLTNISAEQLSGMDQVEITCGDRRSVAGVVDANAVFSGSQQLIAVVGEGRQVMLVGVNEPASVVLNAERDSRLSVVSVD